MLKQGRLGPGLQACGPPAGLPPEASSPPGVRPGCFPASCASLRALAQSVGACPPPQPPPPTAVLGSWSGWRELVVLSVSGHKGSRPSSKPHPQPIKTWSGGGAGDGAPSPRAARLGGSQEPRETSQTFRGGPRAAEERRGAFPGRAWAPALDLEKSADTRGRCSSRTSLLSPAPPPSHQRPLSLPELCRLSCWSWAAAGASPY